MNQMDFCQNPAKSRNLWFWKLEKWYRTQIVVRNVFVCNWCRWVQKLAHALSHRVVTYKSNTPFLRLGSFRPVSFTRRFCFLIKQLEIIFRHGLERLRRIAKSIRFVDHINCFLCVWRRLCLAAHTNSQFWTNSAATITFTMAQPQVHVISKFP